MTPAPFYTPSEAATVLNCTPSAVRLYLKRGVLPHVLSAGGTVKLIPARALRRFVRPALGRPVGSGKKRREAQDAVG